MLPFGVTIPATVPQSSEIPEGLMNYSVYHVIKKKEKTRVRRIKRNGLPKLGPYYEPNGKTRVILQRKRTADF